MKNRPPGKPIEQVIDELIALCKTRHGMILTREAAEAHLNQFAKEGWMEIVDEAGHAVDNPFGGETND